MSTSTTCNVSVIIVWYITENWEYMLEFEADKAWEHDSKAANIFWILAGKIKQEDWGNEQEWIK